jgi:probable rRNA maturation factor
MKPMKKSRLKGAQMTIGHKAMATVDDGAVELVVQYALPSDGLPAQVDFERWVAAALADLGQAVEIVIRVVDKAESAELNKRYRAKHEPTNVLSFSFEAPVGMDALALLGDIVICAPVVQHEAQQQGKSALAHWAHMIVHGVLHLRGYDHQTEQEAQEMEARERVILTGLGYGDPY